MAHSRPGVTSRVRALPSPGVIVLDEDNEVDSISPEAEHWLSEWGLSDLKRPPVALTAVVGAARARAHGPPRIIPSARLRLRTGDWLHVRATHLAGAIPAPHRRCARARRPGRGRAAGRPRQSAHRSRNRDRHARATRFSAPARSRPSCSSPPTPSKTTSSRSSRKSVCATLSRTRRTIRN